MIHVQTKQPVNFIINGKPSYKSGEWNGQNSSHWQGAKRFYSYEIDESKLKPTTKKHYEKDNKLSESYMMDSFKKHFDHNIIFRESYDTSKDFNTERKHLFNYKNNISKFPGSVKFYDETKTKDTCFYEKDNYCDVFKPSINEYVSKEFISLRNSMPSINGKNVGRSCGKEGLFVNYYNKDNIEKIIRSGNPLNNDYGLKKSNIRRDIFGGNKQEIIDLSKKSSNDVEWRLSTNNHNNIINNTSNNMNINKSFNNNSNSYYNNNKIISITEPNKNDNIPNHYNSKNNNKAGNIDVSNSSQLKLKQLTNNRYESLLTEANNKDIYTNLDYRNKYKDLSKKAYIPHIDIPNKTSLPLQEKKKLYSLDERRNFIPCLSPGDKTFKSPEFSGSFFKEQYIPTSDMSPHYDRGNSKMNVNFYNSLVIPNKNITENYNKEKFYDNYLNGFNGKSRGLKEDKTYVSKNIKKWENDFNKGLGE